MDLPLLPMSHTIDPNDLSASRSHSSVNNDNSIFNDLFPCIENWNNEPHSPNSALSDTALITDDDDSDLPDKRHRDEVDKEVQKRRRTNQFTSYQSNYNTVAAAIECKDVKGFLNSQENMHPRKGISIPGFAIEKLLKVAEEQRMQEVAELNEEVLRLRNKVAELENLLANSAQAKQPSSRQRQKFTEYVKSQGLDEMGRINLVRSIIKFYRDCKSMRKTRSQFNECKPSIRSIGRWNKCFDENLQLIGRRELGK